MVQIWCTQNKGMYAKIRNCQQLIFAGQVRLPGELQRCLDQRGALHSWRRPAASQVGWYCHQHFFQHFDFLSDLSSFLLLHFWNVSLNPIFSDAGKWSLFWHNWRAPVAFLSLTVWLTDSRFTPDFTTGARPAPTTYPTSTTRLTAFTRRDHFDNVHLRDPWRNISRFDVRHK